MKGNDEEMNGGFSSPPKGRASMTDVLVQMLGGGKREQLRKKNISMFYEKLQSLRRSDMFPGLEPLTILSQWLLQRDAYAQPLLG